MTRLGDFWKFLALKIAKNFGDFFKLSNRSFFLGNFRKLLGYLPNIPASGHNAGKAHSNTIPTIKQ